MPMRGAIFVFSAKIRLETAYNRGILHTPQANGGAIAPPDYATVTKQVLSKTFHYFR